MRKVVLLVCFLNISINASNLKDAKSDEFLVKKVDVQGKEASRSELKETFGEEIRLIVEATIQLMDAVGDLQVGLIPLVSDELRLMTSAETDKKNDCISGITDVQRGVGEICKTLASVQRMLSSSLEKLLDNQAPFKRASMPDLQLAVKIITTSHYQLKNQIRSLKGLVHSLKTRTGNNKNTENELKIKAVKDLILQENSAMKKVCENLQKNTLIKQV